MASAMVQLPAAVSEQTLSPVTDKTVEAILPSTPDLETVAQTLVQTIAAEHIQAPIESKILTTVEVTPVEVQEPEPIEVTEPAVVEVQEPAPVEAQQTAPVEAQTVAPVQTQPQSTLGPIVYELTVPVFVQCMKNEIRILQQAQEWCKENGHDESMLSKGQLVSNMFSLPFHVDFGSFILTQWLIDCKIYDGPALPIAPSEKTIDEMLVRVHYILELLESLRPEQFIGKESEIFIFRSKDSSPSQNGLDYVRETILPSFWFHHNMIYSILRVLGVPSMKNSYIATRHGMAIIERAMLG